jgi:putative cardiolipin synthase
MLVRKTRLIKSGILRMLLPFRVVVILSAVAVVNACTFLPDAGPQPLERALPSSTTGKLAKFSEAIAETFGEGQSGFLMIPEARSALLWRLALADLATTSIDIQYFIWQGDESSGLLFDRLLRAADRGVRVRLLVDDLVLATDDRTIGAISQHPNVNIKLFNPGKVRDSTLGGLGNFLLNFRQLNRRMHNKMFAVDNHVAIIGGRNIGNPYFGLSEKYNFMDLDLLMAGPIVTEVTQAFDEYWNVERAYPGSALAGKVKPGDIEALLEGLADQIEEDSEFLQSYPIDDYNWDTEWSGLMARMDGGEGHFVQDVPVEIHGDNLRLVDMLDYLFGPTDQELIIGSPYLIPSKDFLEGLARLAEKGITVKIITGSLASNNHTAAHSHYKKYRKRILATGAELYEFRAQPSAGIRAAADVPPVTAKFISLHTKTLSADGERCFIGSLNLDPRAVEINTENGLYIESAGLCSKLTEGLKALTHPDNAWRVYLNEDNYLRWESSDGTVSRQPARSGWQRVTDFFLRLLPIESQM